MVAHNLHPSDHGADSEETKNLGAKNADLGKLLSVDVAGRVEDCHGIVGADSREECARVAESVGERCQIGLELSHGTS